MSGFCLTCNTGLSQGLSGFGIPVSACRLKHVVWMIRSTIPATRSHPSFYREGRKFSIVTGRPDQSGIPEIPNLKIFLLKMGRKL